MSWQIQFPILLKNVYYTDIVSSIYFAFNHLLSFLLSTCTPQIFFCHSFAQAFFELSTTFIRKVYLVVGSGERYSQVIVCSFPGNLRVFRDNDQGKEPTVQQIGFVQSSFGHLSTSGVESIVGLIAQPTALDLLTFYLVIML